MWPQSLSSQAARATAVLLLEAPEITTDAAVSLLGAFVLRVVTEEGRAPRMISLPQALAVVRSMAAKTFASAVGHQGADLVARELELWPEVLPLDTELAYPLPVMVAIGLALGARLGREVRDELDACRVLPMVRDV